MLRSRKPKLPGDTQDSASTSAAELVQRLTSRRDTRALPASSTTIALSYGTRSTPSNGATVRGRDTGWKTAYDAAKMALEIANEACDMFLPLKAVVGVMSVFVRNYDVSVSRLRTEHLAHCPSPTQQTSDNAEKVKEIERRVHSLSGVLASPVGEDDYTEKRRRAELRRFVLVQTHNSLLIPLLGSSRGLSRNLNHFPTNVCLLGSCAMSTMPKS